MQEQFCPGCSNRCPVDALSCGKGRAYFGIDNNDGGKRFGKGGHGFKESSDEIVNLLRKCGHTLHHAHGEEEVKLDCLSESERNELKKLLIKCLQNLDGKGK